jgi:hypothetical protein
MYFKNIPGIYYLFDIGGEQVLKPMLDITHNIRIRKSILENISLYDEYDIQEGETPEIIADKVYGSSEYHWIIMLCNQRYDYLSDFPMTERALKDYVFEKYEDPYAIHHYVNDQGFVVMSDIVGATPVTNYDHETEVNEKKRRIKLISPTLLGQILAEYKLL